MGEIIYIILAALVGIGVGAAIAGLLIKNKNQKLEEETKERIKSMLREAEINAESIKKDRILEAKEKYLKLKSDFDEEMSNKKQTVFLQRHQTGSERQSSLIPCQTDYFKTQGPELQSIIGRFAPAGFAPAGFAPEGFTWT